MPRSKPRMHVFYFCDGHNLVLKSMVLLSEGFCQSALPEKRHFRNGRSEKYGRVLSIWENGPSGEVRMVARWKGFLQTGTRNVYREQEPWSTTFYRKGVACQTKEYRFSKYGLMMMSTHGRRATQMFLVPELMVPNLRAFPSVG